VKRARDDAITPITPITPITLITRAPACRKRGRSERQQR
jgi:hypothetical protein